MVIFFSGFVPSMGSLLQMCGKSLTFHLYLNYSIKILIGLYEYVGKESINGPHNCGERWQKQVIIMLGDMKPCSTHSEGSETHKLAYFSKILYSIPLEHSLVLSSHSSIQVYCSWRCETRIEGIDSSCKILNIPIVSYCPHQLWGLQKPDPSESLQGKLHLPSYTFFHESQILTSYNLLYSRKLLMLLKNLYKNIESLICCPLSKHLLKSTANGAHAYLCSMV